MRGRSNQFVRTTNHERQTPKEEGGLALARHTEEVKDARRIMRWSAFYQSPWRGYQTTQHA